MFEYGKLRLLQAKQRKNLKTLRAKEFLFDVERMNSPLYNEFQIDITYFHRYIFLHTHY